MLENSEPLVSVGLPTYNRAHKIKRAVESILAQDYSNIELVISDNASTDGTEAFCQELCRSDTRVRYIRQPFNKGLTVNYDEVLRHSRGEFFMWLSDDDWLDDAYIRQCLQVLQEHPDYISVCGRAKYHQDGETFFENEADLLQDSGAERVTAYYQNVGRNNSIYGVMRRADLLQTTMHNTLGGDWYLVAAVAFLGKLKIIDGVSIHRTCDGVSANFVRLGRTLGLSKFRSQIPFLTLPFYALTDILWRAKVYQSLGLFERLTLASRAAKIICRRQSIPYCRNLYYTWKGRMLPHYLSLKRMLGLQSHRGVIK